jgi:hypothetical protein
MVAREKIRGLAILAIVIVATSGGTWALTTLSVPHSRRVMGPGFSVIARLHRGASSRDKGRVAGAPSRALLLAVEGRNAIYLQERRPQLYCLVDSGPMAVDGLCTTAPTVEQRGLVSVFRQGESPGGSGRPASEQVVVLVPDDVSRVEFVDTSGQHEQVAVSNNFAVSSNVATATVRYTMPAGLVCSTDVAALSIPVRDAARDYVPMRKQSESCRPIG